MSYKKNNQQLLMGTILNYFANFIIILITMIIIDSCNNNSINHMNITQEKFDHETSPEYSGGWGWYHYYIIIKATGY